MIQSSTAFPDFHGEETPVLLFYVFSKPFRLDPELQTPDNIRTVFVLLNTPESGGY
jgi:hypothetical protein